MNGIKDERVCFYLRHHEDIERWAAIKSDIPRHIHSLLLSLERDVQSLSKQLDAYTYFTQLESRYPKLFLVRRSWLANSEQARAAIGLEWEANKVDLLHHHPYVGVWVNMEREGAQALHDRLKNMLGASVPSSTFTANRWWPARRMVAPEKGDVFWNDFNPYRQKLLDQIDRAWSDFADVVDRGMRSATSGERGA